jgi:uncharacterized membrane-anchored protein YitT (DUF2179 family)
VKVENIASFKSIRRMAVTAVSVAASAFIQAAAMRTFLQPVNLLPGGFTGIATLLSILTQRIGVPVTVGMGMVALNIPAALLCSRSIGRKFVVFSLAQVLMTSLLLGILPARPLFDDVLLNICFGGTLYGISAVTALRGNASTGGTDFIALYVSNRLGKSIWQYVFVFNAAMLCVFGAISGWESAGYSILFQFISTKTIEAFYHRYKRVTLQATTQKANEIVAAFIKHSMHGISVLEGRGGYSGKKMSILHTVISAYEEKDIVNLFREVDPGIIINVLPTEDFFGKYYSEPVD